ncbi:MAG: flavodoxin family protein [Synergistaceae bacterium]|nr:flavodoxin family protein [Synergistaceae bacterium]
MSRKITILLGSPRRNGNSDTLAGAFASGAAEAGYRTHSIRITGLKVGGCIDCRRCWTNGTHCFINDDMKEVYAHLDKSSVIVYASPLYFFSWSSQIKPLWDRMLPYSSVSTKVKMKGRRAVLIATAGDKDESSFAGLRKSFELASEYIGWKIAGELLASGLHGPDEAKERKDLLDRAFEMGKNL